MADTSAEPASRDRSGTLKRTRVAAPRARKLRRTQSALAAGAGDPPGSVDSGSDSDLPDACSLLQTPMPKARGRARARARPLALAKSASDVAPQSSRTGDTDGGSGAGLRIPGELVLAYALRKYYPARVAAQTGPNRFAVEFFDGSRGTLTRGRILTMYESRFHTCPLGGLRLVGDQPAASAQQDGAAAADPERDFERDRALFHRLVGEVEAVRDCLDALHSCPADKVDALCQIEDRMAAFFGSDAVAKRRLVSRVAKGHLNRAEFDFLGRLLCRWYAAPPRALLQLTCESVPTDDADAAQDTAPLDKGEPADGAAPSDNPEPVNTSVSADDAEADPDKVPADKDVQADDPELARGAQPASDAEHVATPDSDTSRVTEPVVAAANPKLAAQTVDFVHEVLLPHAIRRLTMAREQCTLAEAELRMIRSDSDWVDQILAARETRS